MSDQNLFAQQEENRRRSTWLVVGFVVFFMWIGFGGDLAFYLLTRDGHVGGYHHVVPFIGIMVSLAAAGIAWSAWRNGAQRVLAATGAMELIDPATPELKQLDNVVEEMAIASGVPKPKIWIVPDADPNAFATGRDPQTANIAVTEGLLKLLNRDELQGVIAHEMSHVKNYDIRLTTLMAALVGAIALLSDFLGRGGSAGRGIRLGSDRENGKSGGSPLGIIILVLWLLTLVVAPLVSQLLAMGVSRKRELLADASGAQFTRNPMGLASALEKIDAMGEPTRAITRGAAHLCIVDPLGRRLTSNAGWLGNIFATHPPMALRVSRLKAMAYLNEHRVETPAVPPDTKG